MIQINIISVFVPAHRAYLMPTTRNMVSYTVVAVLVINLLLVFSIRITDEAHSYTLLSHLCTSTQLSSCSMRSSVDANGKMQTASFVGGRHDGASVCLVSVDTGGYTFTSVNVCKQKCTQIDAILA